MKINFREPSTKRGIVMIITGGIVLYQIFWGSGSVDVDRILARVEWWLGVGLTLVGMLGLLPDQPPRNPQERTRATDLPPIDFVGRAAPDERLRQSLPPGRHLDADADSGWNG